MLWLDHDIVSSADLLALCEADGMALHNLLDVRLREGGCSRE